MAEDFCEDYRPWEELPPNALVTIFKKLSIEDRFCGGPIVCRSWREASKNPLCWVSMLRDDIDQDEIEEHFIKKQEEFWTRDFSEIFCFCDSSSDLSEEGVRMFIERSNGNAQTILLPNRLRTNDLLDFIAQRCPKLKNLSARWTTMYFEQDPEGLVKLLNSCKELEILDLAYFFEYLTTDMLAGLEFCPKLRGLRLSRLITTRLGPDELGIDSEEFDGFFLSFRNIELLNLSECLESNDVEKILDQLKNLKYLRLEGPCDLMIDGGGLAKKYKRIPEVHVDLWDCIDDDYDYGYGHGYDYAAVVDGGGIAAAADAADGDDVDNDDFEFGVGEQVCEEEREKWILLEESRESIMKKRAELDEKQSFVKSMLEELDEINKSFRAEVDEKRMLFRDKIDEKKLSFRAKMAERHSFFLAEMDQRFSLFMKEMDEEISLFFVEMNERDKMNGSQKLSRAELDERYRLFDAVKDAMYCLFNAEKDENYRFFNAEKDERFSLFDAEMDELYLLFNAEMDERFKLYDVEVDERKRQITAALDDMKDMNVELLNMMGFMEDLLQWENFGVNL